MNPVRTFLAAALALALAPSAQARAPLDCPLRDAPFSAASPLVDILLSKPATAAFEQAAPGMLAKLPPLMTGTAAPTFGAIVTPREALMFVGADTASVDRVDVALRKVAVTPADRTARCARYDAERTPYRLAPGKPAILLFEKMTGFRDTPSVLAAHAMVVDLAKARGWQVVSTDRAGLINAADLRRFRAVVWNNISGDVLTLTQRRAFRSWVENGGGYVGMHGSSGDPVSFWPWYADTLIGARFAGHPMNPQFQQARVLVDNPRSPMAKGLPASWSMTDEWYSFVASPRAVPGTHVVLALDEASYAPGTGFGRDLRMGDHPIAWTRAVGKGRMAYSAIGHRPEVYADPNNRRLIENALAWTMQLKDGEAAN
ncbi:ThuA domain-containing protein [Novosphingobium olei]|uniref:ThuA domain-containing protein n=1 Tax=Novosphingobium olei TaxID=2728851 RepID=A0A7Y0G991_9SPHN|nr:ThuA domain-containing protein [Novosphingobium olei]NML92407.1 ThuA domain-containing protein [Novosphingobium olei]